MFNGTVVAERRQSSLPSVDVLPPSSPPMPPCPPARVRFPPRVVRHGLLLLLPVSRAEGPSGVVRSRPPRPSGDVADHHPLPPSLRPAQARIAEKKRAKEQKKAIKAQRKAKKAAKKASLDRAARGGACRVGLGDAEERAAPRRSARARNVRSSIVSPHRVPFTRRILSEWTSRGGRARPTDRPTRVGRGTGHCPVHGRVLVGRTTVWEEWRRSLLRNYRDCCERSFRVETQGHADNPSGDPRHPVRCPMPPHPPSSADPSPAGQEAAGKGQESREEEGEGRQQGEIRNCAGA